LITTRGVGIDVTDEISYKVGAMTVTFEMAPDDAPRPWDSVECECEEFGKGQQNVLKSTDDKKCRHIREAEMYHHYEQKVTPVENE
jgi:hypothetical protein